MQNDSQHQEKLILKAKKKIHISCKTLIMIHSWVLLGSKPTNYLLSGKVPKIGPHCTRNFNMDDTSTPQSFFD